MLKLSAPILGSDLLPVSAFLSSIIGTPFETMLLVSKESSG